LDSSEEALVQGLSAQPFLIKPNREEAEAVLGFRITNRYDLKEAANRFHALGIQRVAISCASEGLLLSQNGTTVIAPAPSITVANSVGAGDALLAGLLWAFTNGMNQKESAAWGVATGSAAVQMEGVNFAAYPVVENIFSFVIKNIVIL
jgi:fructose-1-phosphate kinase PfkB-like protein